MKIAEIKIKIRDLVEGYTDYSNKEGGIIGYDGRLDIRPAYQREFVYKEKQREAVIDTIIKGLPLNTMYWAVRSNGNFEIIDGQQRTISICQFVKGDFPYKSRYYDSFLSDEKIDIMNYELVIYLCDGTDSEKLAWFETINIAGEKLTLQELRNAVCSGSWVTSAKKDFSKNDCPAHKHWGRYLKTSRVRQETLEKAIDWIRQTEKDVKKSKKTDGKDYEDTILEYMSKHQHNENASELWKYFDNVFKWVENLFPDFKDYMKGLEWGLLYNEFKDIEYNKVELVKRVIDLMQDEDVTNKSGVYEYLLRGEREENEKYLNIRNFDMKEKRIMYEKQRGNCVKCRKHFDINEMESDHIKPWSKGGKTELKNGQLLCIHCNRRKSNK